MWASTLLLMGLNAAPAHAAAEDWAGTRWLMQVEEVLPVPIDLTAMSNLGFLTKALQLQVIAQCDEAEQRNKKVFVLTCRIDDARMRATPHGESPTERELENSSAALKEFAARMITTEVEVQFHSSGKVMRVDVLGLEATEPREKQSAELLRQLATDLVMGWTVKLPKEWGGAWAETNSPIFRVPAHPAWNTSNQIRHAASDVDGKRVVESIGRGIFTTAYDPWELEANARLGQAITADQSAEGAGGTRGEDGVGATVYGGRLVGGGPVMASSTPEAREYEATSAAWR